MNLQLNIDEQLALASVLGVARVSAEADHAKAVENGWQDVARIYAGHIRNLEMVTEAFRKAEI